MRSRTSASLILLGCSLFLTAALARAQEPQLFLTDQRAFGQLGPAPSSQPQSEPVEYSDELGTIHPLITLRYDPFQAYSETSYLYDDNILLTYHKPVHDEILDQVLGASYSPRLFEDLKTTVYGQYYYDHYNSKTAFDFDGEQLGIDLAYPLVKPPIPYHQENTVSAWTLYGDASYERLNLTDGDILFFGMVDARLGLRCDFNAILTLWNGVTQRIAPYYGYQLDWRNCYPSILSRGDNTIFLGANTQLLRKLFLQVQAEAQYESYLNFNRSDLAETLSASFVYRICDNASLNLNGLFANNNSSRNTFSYRVINAGPNITLQVRF
ncbi:MAG TPA: hypothetical protein VMP11_08995 [Verrucomicrobiae bacterium]|nr:hypothetical protein [Verrucomicrobiae bacterium]